MRLRRSAVLSHTFQAGACVLACARMIHGLRGLQTPIDLNGGFWGRGSSLQSTPAAGVDRASRPQGYTLAEPHCEPMLLPMP